MNNIPEKDRTFLSKFLLEADKYYDKNWKGLSSYLDKANYHTRLACCTVHSTRSALTYAVALLDEGSDENLVRADEIIDNMLNLQDRDPASATFGIWSWYMEEPLSQMAPPDWNWADFCGKELLQIYLHHRSRLPSELIDRLVQGIENCCLSIFRRNMHYGYTNISIMGSYVTLCAGETFGWKKIYEYGKSRFLKFRDFTRRNGVFAEYNSPTYTVVAAEDLTRINNDIKDPVIKEASLEMLDAAWSCIASHYHAPTGQWAGPYARAYSCLLTDNTKSFLQQSLGDTVSLIDNKSFKYDPAWVHIPLSCPEKYRDSFTVCLPHDVNIGFSDTADDRPSVAAISHIEEKYTLGSWVCRDTWNQRRNIFGFWGGKNVRFINTGILHDFYDFSSGFLTTAQHKGSLLTSVSLWTDGGDTHCNLDIIKDAYITAGDLRFRIEIGGAGEISPYIKDNTVYITDEEMDIRIKLCGGSFDGENVRLELGDSDSEYQLLKTQSDLHRRFNYDSEKRRYIDVVLYSGPEKDFRLDKLSDAYASVFVSFDGYDCDALISETDNGMIHSSVSAGDLLLETYVPRSPKPSSDKSHSAWVNGKNLLKEYGVIR